MPELEAAAAGATDASAAASTEAGTLLGEDGKPKAAAEIAGEKPKEGVVTDEAKKAADEQAAKAKAEVDAKAAAVPEKYDLKLPEGTIVDAPMMEEFTAWAKENGWTNEQAQKAADLHMKSIGAFAQKQAAEFTAMIEGWGDEFKNDKTLVGVDEKGVPKVDATLAASRKVLNALGTPEEVKRLQDDFNRLGLGNHPILIKGLARFAEFVGDDNVVIGRGASGQATDVAHRLYPNNP